MQGKRLGCLPTVPVFCQGGRNADPFTTDANRRSPFRDCVYVAWDAASGGSSSGGVRLARSRNGGVSFTTVRIDDPNGPGRSIGATVTTGPDGQVYVAWNDIAANTIAFNNSFDGGVTFGTPRVIASLPPGIIAIDGMPDRQKWLALVPENAGAGTVTVVQNWAAGLKK